MYLIKLPMPPTVNNYYGHNGRIRFIRKEGTAYRKEVCKIVAEKGWDFQANVKLKVMVVLNFGRAGTNDLDNRMKALLDACTHAKVWEDDSLIDDLHILRGPEITERGVMLQVQAVEDVEDY